METGRIYSSILNIKWDALGISRDGLTCALYRGPPIRRRVLLKLNPLLLLASLIAISPLNAKPTEIVVRVISQDAKFVGESMGGAEVILRDAKSGNILAKGVTSGGTGDTEKIMAAKGRSPDRASDTAAAFRTTIDIKRPLLVRVEISGPLGFPKTMQRAMSERWLIPGPSASVGDGWVIELPGLAVRMIAPTPSLFTRGQPNVLTAEVQLMCGCPITPGGLWNSANYDVRAEIRQRGMLREEILLPFVAAPGRFEANWTPKTSGKADLIIIASNRITGNTGVLTKKIQVK